MRPSQRVGRHGSGRCGCGRERRRSRRGPVAGPSRRPQPSADPTYLVGTLPDRRLLEVGGTLDVDVSPAFADPDGDTLTYKVSSSPPRVVTMFAAGARVTLAAVAEGTVTIRVTATDPGDLAATQTKTFRVVVGAARPSKKSDRALPGQCAVSPISVFNWATARALVWASRSACRPARNDRSRAMDSSVCWCASACRTARSSTASIRCIARFPTVLTRRCARLIRALVSVRPRRSTIAPTIAVTMTAIVGTITAARPSTNSSVLIIPHSSGRPFAHAGDLPKDGPDDPLDYLVERSESPEQLVDEVPGTSHQARTVVFAIALLL